MFRRSGKIVAEKAEIHADEWGGKTAKIRQTGAHHAGKETARGNVRIFIRKQYQRQDTDSERPEEGSVVEGDKAEVSARRWFGPFRSKRFKGQITRSAEGNVQAVVYKEEEGKE